MGFFTHRPFGRAAALTLAAAMLLGAPSALAAQVPVELLGQENSISAPSVALTRSGKCGEAVNWGLGADNVLYIYGSGPMSDFSTNEGSRAPWAEELLAASPDGLSTIQAVQVCEGVTKLGAFAFNNVGSAYYTGLTSITLPDSLQEVGRRALYGCKALSSIEVSAANPCLAVQDGILYNKAMTQLIRCPAAGGLTAYTVPASVTELAEGAFASCTSLESIVLPEGMTSIADNAFEGCSALREVTLPSTLKTLNYACFGWCSSLTNIVLPEGTEKLDWSVFASCTSLSSVTIPSSVKTIDVYAFNKCPLKEVKISKDCVLGSQAFGKDVKIKYYH